MPFWDIWPPTENIHVFIQFDDKHSEWHTCLQLSVYMWAIHLSHPSSIDPSIHLSTTHPSIHPSIHSSTCLLLFIMVYYVYTHYYRNVLSFWYSIMSIVTRERITLTVYIWITKLSNIDISQRTVLLTTEDAGSPNDLSESLSATIAAVFLFDSLKELHYLTKCI